MKNRSQMINIFVLLILTMPFVLSACGSGATEVATTEVATTEVATEVTIEAVAREAPMLQEKVANGELPPLDERLPEDPFVVTPVHEIGQYGGTWRQAVTGWNAWALWYYDIKVNEVRYTPDFTTIIPVLLKDYEVSDDLKVYTFYLRHGIKWSDGDPYDADDYAFWWNDVVLNDELMPGKPPEFMAGGELAKFEVLDQYTIRFTFSVPYALFLDQLAQPRYWGPLALPSHYLKQFHPNYTSEDELSAVMAEKGFDTWTDLFNTMNYAGGNPDLPALEAWKALDPDTGTVQHFVRNPYFWQVDTDGNQLPYIDYIEVQLLQDSEACLLKALAGEVDFQWRNIASLDNYTVVLENAYKGNYHIVPTSPSNANLYSIYFNYTIEDPVKNALFNDLRFRQALSYAINRQQINDLLQKGMAPPSQISPPARDPAYVEETALIYTEYDIDKANELLDAIGLPWDAAHQWRLDPAGNKLEFEKIFYTTWPKHQAEAQDLIAQSWALIGIKVNNKALEQSLWAAQMLGGQYEMSAKAVEIGGTPYLPLGTQSLFPIDEYWWTEPAWGRWLASGGAQGVEPPAEVKRLYNLYFDFLNTTDPAERLAIEKDAFALFAKNLLSIGVLSRSDREIFSVVSNRFRNVPDWLLDDTTYWHPAQFYIVSDE